MPGLPELPVTLDEPVGQVVGDVQSHIKPIYQTHRGKIPFGHEDKRPALHYPVDGAIRYREED